ncbi:fluoride efflux transporter CrcB [Oryzibacter oryziterrae]|uniref:fluoride efflux transporter CrcB n=1 Tax=Oryzibacter oryziterrae TaxID=2766474 RepID=UPI001F3108F6|nr:fluoride efflux transporter CrcB [Oryzibacter oryziterrae]
MSLNLVLLVALGGALGSVARYLVGVAAGKLFGADFPWGTVTVNVLGSIIMGLFIGLLSLKFNGSQALRVFFAVGILGGFTTLSSFALDSVTLWERGAYLSASGYVIGTLIASIGGLVAGLWIVRSFA